MPLACEYGGCTFVMDSFTCCPCVTLEVTGYFVFAVSRFRNVAPLLLSTTARLRVSITISQPLSFSEVCTNTPLLDNHTGGGDRDIRGQPSCLQQELGRY